MVSRVRLVGGHAARCLGRITTSLHPSRGHGACSSTTATSQEQLAAMWSSSRQSVNRVLNQLKQEGVLKVACGQITLVDLERLRAR